VAVLETPKSLLSSREVQWWGLQRVRLLPLIRVLTERGGTREAQLWHGAPAVSHAGKPRTPVREVE